uniref:Low-temperature-induced 78 kDa protein n=1 Tax=Noccaea caerulescens TaxID=107243 RepID=A0A1J3E7K5_NOCCA
MDTTRSSGHEQVEDPTKINHPEEEENHESGASKMYKRVKARAKKIKNSLTKQGNEPNPDQDVEEEEEDDDENDDQEPQKHVAPGVTGQPESLSHPRETKVPEEITPPEKKVYPDVSSDYSKLDEPETLRDASYGHEALSRPVRSEDTRDAPAYPGKTSDLTDVEESRVPLSTSETTAFAPPGEYLGRQPEVNTESERGVSDYQSKVTHQGGGEGGVPEITESVGRMKVMEESFDQKSESEIAKDSPAVRSFGFDQKTEGSGIDKDSPAAIFGGNPGAELREDIPARSHEFEQIESGIGKDSPTRFGGKPEAETKEGFPAKSHGFEQTIGSVVGKDTGVGEPGTERREDFLGKNYEFEKEMDSAIGKDSPTRFAGESETGLGEGFSLKNDSIGKESESGLDKEFPAASDDVKAETGLGRDFKTEFNEQFSPEFSGPKERDNFDSEAEPKPNTYTEMIGSATTSVTGKAVAAKDTVASSLGYSGETAGHESPVGVETPADKSIPDEENVKDIGSPFATKLPLSGGGSGAEEKYVQTSDYLPEKEKLTPEEEDKAFSEMIKGKLNLEGEKKTTEAKEVEVTAEKIPSDEVSEEKEHGEAAAPEVEAGGGMVGKIKGAYNYWLGGTTEEVKPKSPVSGHESPQSLDSTAGTKGSSDSGETGLGETGGSTGALPVQKGL